MWNRGRAACSLAPIPCVRTASACSAVSEGLCVTASVCALRTALHSRGATKARRGSARAMRSARVEVQLSSCSVLLRVAPCCTRLPSDSGTARASSSSTSSRECRHRSSAAATAIDSAAPRLRVRGFPFASDRRRRQGCRCPHPSTRSIPHPSSRSIPPPRSTPRLRVSV